MRLSPSIDFHIAAKKTLKRPHTVLRDVIDLNLTKVNNKDKGLKQDL